MTMTCLGNSLPRKQDIRFDRGRISTVNVQWETQYEQKEIQSPPTYTYQLQQANSVGYSR